MFEDVRRFVEATLERLTPARAQAMARRLVSGGGREQVDKLARELMEWSRRNRERLERIVQRQVRAQLKALGVATKEEVESLKRRVRDLERTGAGGAKRPASRPAAPKAGGAKAKG